VLNPWQGKCTVLPGRIDAHPASPHLHGRTGLDGLQPTSTDVTDAQTDPAVVKLQVPRIKIDRNEVLSRDFVAGYFLQPRQSQVSCAILLSKWRASVRPRYPRVPSLHASPDKGEVRSKFRSAGFTYDNAVHTLLSHDYL
jgi:hypothetical protein